ncbi:P-loop containing nucleoside triphosphate hydrolase protein [Cercophora newfieldiana]|uniref:P-loop containing nucleoside triphosphate hydrolase protein n=1 Tax=Cercophora newfieldiana TaxID=92897 RepID=A0AA39XZR5_9PEZI|nr:P-loop containing nucleoside triphosphate hydrolase protein [Cercophora newfieldiana]
MALNFNGTTAMSSSDHLFGPQLPTHFDFTLTFEHSILSLPPSALFLLFAAYTVSSLHQRSHNRYDLNENVILRSGSLYVSKILACILLCCFQLAVVIQWGVYAAASKSHGVAVGSSVLSFLCSVMLTALVDASHRASVAPSLLTGAYLFLTTVFDLAQARSLYLRYLNGAGRGFLGLGVTFTLGLVAKGVLLLLEEMPKVKRTNPLAKTAGPETVSGAVNRTLFVWLNGLFLRGYKSLLGVGDLDNIPAKFKSERLLNKLEPQWETAKAKGTPGKNDFVWATMKSFAGIIFLAVPPRLVQGALTFTQPLLMKEVILYVGSGQTNPEIARGLIGATVLIYVGMAVAECVHMHLVYQTLTMVRGALVGIIFKKTVGLGEKELEDGASVTLMSTDVEGVEMGLLLMHSMWVSPIEVGVGMYLLYREVGIPCFLAVFPILVATALNERIAKKIGPAKMAWNQGIQERVSATSSMLGQMKGIKMSGLGRFFAKHVQSLRDEEIKLSKTFRMSTILLNLIMDMVDRFTPIIVITGAVFWTRGDDRELPVAQAFTSITIVALVAQPMNHLLATRTLLQGTLASFTRIQSYLLLPDKKEYREFVDIRFPEAATPDSKHKEAIELNEIPADGEPTVEIRNATFETTDGKVLLRDANLVVKDGSCHMIAGLVGSGKSSVLKAIMGELKLTRGSVQVKESSVAYCAQSPWLRNVTIRENIVGGANLGFDADWFARVVQACALDQDFADIPDWDNSLVGSGGVILSGGQKQRVALARAVYSHKKLVVLDDVFSGLDHKTSSFVFDQLLGAGGLLRQPQQTVILTTNQPRVLSFADSVSTVQSSTLKTVKKEAILSSIDEDITSTSSSSDEKPRPQSQDSKPAGFGPAQKAEDEAHSDLKRQTGDTSLYKYYFQSVGWKLATIFVASSILCAGIWRMPQVWLKIWTDHGTGNDTALYYGVYVGFAVVGSLAAFTHFAFFFFVFIPKSSKHLHFIILDTVLKAPLYFFTTVDSGITLNRFSQDLTLIDQRLPMSLLFTAFLLLDIIASMALIVSGAQYSASMLPFILTALYFLQKFYLRTSRQMRFLEIEAKSPLYTHFTETLAGAVTVRAFGWERAFLEENQRRLDASQKPLYLMYCLQRWLGVVLDLLVTSLAVGLVSFAVLFTLTSSSSAIGLSFVSIVGFSQALSGFIQMWTQLEMSLGAIARVRTFVSSTPRESLPSETLPPPPGWPTSGDITITNLTASYSPDLPPTLNGLSLSIPPGSHVAVVGRTGSGKSSLLLTLARLLDISSGTIEIDGIDISRIPREEIRRCIASLPQDPVTVPGTVRTNLSPLASESAAPDADLISALTKAQIWDLISSRGGLDAQMDSVNLSPGQRQLFCLAAASVRKAKVVLLDEVTGSVDWETDKEVRRTLMGEELKGCTVVEVVHRVEMVMGYDVVVVMDGGKVVEVGAPRELVGKEDGVFRVLWEGGSKES